MTFGGAHIFQSKQTGANLVPAANIVRPTKGVNSASQKR